jgi:hypothetical protein
MPRGEQRNNREKKKPKKDKSAKHTTAYAAEYGRQQQAGHITDNASVKKQ